MTEPLENTHLIRREPLPSPDEVKRRLPAPRKTRDAVRRARAAVRDALHGRDPHRLVAIVGPCSIHDEDAAIEYATRLAAVAERTQDALVVVMRTYFEKPRTTIGWKGLLNDPHLDGTCDVAAGIERARHVLLAVNAIGLPCATEALDLVTPDYLADLLAWTSIGARTVESQTHRQLASGLSMPVGFKNGTDGRISSAAQAMVAAREPHTFLGVAPDGRVSLVSTRGNPDRHVILRGGASGPNHGAEHVREALRQVADQGIARPVLVDCSHGNSQKDPARQPGVCRDVMDQVRSGERGILGVMLESNLVAGAQSWAPGAPLERGVSITDACMGWVETEALLDELAETVRGARREETLAS